MLTIERKWWKNTTNEIKDQVLQLDEKKYAGFLAFLKSFPDYVGDVNVLALEKLCVAEFSMLIPVFRVMKDNGKQFTYEFASWKMGVNSGAKGVVLLRVGNKITHFLILRQWKFAICTQLMGAIGGFSEDGEYRLEDTIQREIAEEVGLPQTSEVIDLGGIYPDAGMVNSHVKIFAIVVDVMPKIMHNNLDGKELSGGTILAPISMLRQIVNESDDSYLLAILVRLYAKGYLE